MNESVECSVCLNEFRDPRVLSCGHTFCLQCIEGLTRGDRTLKCPQCRQAHAGFTTATAMPRNITANDLIEALQRTRLLAANGSGGVPVAGSTLNGDGNKNVINCKECPRNCAIHDLMFCTTHNFHVCPVCSQAKHKQCEVVGALEYARKQLRDNKSSLEEGLSTLRRSSGRFQQDIGRRIECLKEWANTLDKILILYEKTGQLVLSRIHNLTNEASSRRELLTETSDADVATLLYRGDLADTDQLLAKCAFYGGIDLEQLAQRTENNTVRRLSKYGKPIFSELDEALRQIEDQLDRMQNGHQTNKNVDWGSIGTIKPSFCVLDYGSNGFIKLKESRSEWMELSQMPKPVLEGVSVTACAGKMYAMGCMVQNGAVTPAMLVYNAQTGTWQNLPPMLTKRTFCGATTLDSRLFLVGGRKYSRDLSSVEQLDLQTGGWTAVKPLTAARSALGLTVLGNQLIAVGGICGTSYLNSVEQYDPRVGTWKPIAPTNDSRSHFACAALGDRLYVAGGYSSSKGYMASVECYDPRADKWTSVKDMCASRCSFALATLDGQLWAAGGQRKSEMVKMLANTCVDTVEIYDENKNAWTTHDLKLPHGQLCGGCVLEF